MDIKNKTILITGAASGLGAATARYLSQKGASLVLCDRDEAVKAVASEVDGIFFISDVTSESEIRFLLTEVEVVHAVVNCAGIVDAKRLVGKSGVMLLEAFERVININLIGTFNVMRLVAEKMISQQPVNDESERGVIINTASIAAFEGQVGQAAYSASKGAVASMTLPVARELGQFGIRVMTIAPGVMATPMMMQMSRDVQDALSADITFPKKFGDPKYFAETVAHIIENSYLNGSTIRLDGGLRMR